MTIRLSRILLLCATIAGLSLAGAAQARPGATTSELPPVITPTTGIIHVTFHLTWQSNLPTTNSIGCSVTLNVQGESSTFREVAVRAGARSGNAGSCVVPIPYSWLLQNPQNDTVQITYEVEDPPETGGNPVLPYRANTQSASIPVPTNGAQINLTVDVTL